ncbi:hypothetical protein DQ240_11405 [Blastococcus sp. TF02A-26]|nr:hypothetical protein DQ240_11405 [Blastococcus sp. TF02A-26]
MPDPEHVYVLNEEVTVVVFPADGGGVRYVLRDTEAHRAEMAAVFGPDSEAATQPDESVPLAEDLSVRLGVGVVSLWDYTGHPAGPVDDRRGKG